MTTWSNPPDAALGVDRREAKRIAPNRAWITTGIDDTQSGIAPLLTLRSRG